MPRYANPSRKAADRLLKYSAVSVIAIVLAHPAFASDDPFALVTTPASRPAQAGPVAGDHLMVEVTINGEAQSRLIDLLVKADGYYLRADQAKYLGLPVKAKGQEFIPLASIPDIKFSYDPRRVRLAIEQLRSATGSNLLDMAARRRLGDDGKALTALVIDYDGIVRADRRGLSAAMLTNFRLSRENLAFETGWNFNSRPINGTSHAIRLDTALTAYDEERGLRGILGDFVVPGGSNRGVRMAGLQFGTDFSLRPDLITYPLPELGGSVSLPSGLDILVNDRRISSAPVEAGDYAVRNVPVPVGRNSVGVVVKNALGVEELRTVQFYTSSAMLAPSLSQSQVNLGFVRRNFGFKSNDYGKLALSASHRRGLSKTITGEASIEVARHYYNLGVGGVVALGDFAAVKASANRSSLTPGNGIAPRKGTMLTLGLESLGGPVSATFEARRASAGYDDLASASGDASPFSRISAGLHFDLKKFGQLNINAVRQHRNRIDALGAHYISDRNNFIGLNYRATVRPGIDLYADVALDPARRKSLSLLVGVSVRFGSRTVAQGSVNRQQRGSDYQLLVQRPDVLPGDIGYYLSGGTGFVDRASGGVSYRGDWGRVEARAETVGGEAVASIGAQGALVFAEGSVIAANRVGEAFAIVRTGDVGQVGVLRDNRPVGVTNDKGLLLVTDLPAFVPTKISLEPDSVATDAVIRRDSAMARAGARSGRLIELPVEKFVAATMQMLGFDSMPLQPGTVVTALPSKTEILVGFDGIVEFDRSRGDSEIEYRDSSGNRCYASIPATFGNESERHLGVAKCTQRIRSVDIAEMGIKPPRKAQKADEQKQQVVRERKPVKTPPPRTSRPMRKTSALDREIRLFAA